LFYLLDNSYLFPGNEPAAIEKSNGSKTSKGFTVILQDEKLFYSYRISDYSTTLIELPPVHWHPNPAEPVGAQCWFRYIGEMNIEDLWFRFALSF